MSTQVFLRAAIASACDNWGPGDAIWNPNTAFYATGASGGLVRSCRLSRGAGASAITSATVASSTARHRLGGLTSASHWVSPPVDRDFTPSSVIYNFWALESSMNANCRIGGYVAKIGPDGTVSSVIADIAEIGIELGTSASVHNFSQTASGSVNRGDRLLIVPYFTNIGTMASGFTITLDFDGATAGADGDSYVTFTEDFGFMQDVASLVAPAPPVDANSGFGGAATNNGLAFRIRSGAARTIASVTLNLKKFGTPADNVVVAIQADSSGVPSGSDLATAGTVAGGTLTTSLADYTIDITDVDIAADTTYWVVVTRSGAVDGTNNYAMQLRDNTNAGDATPWRGGIVKNRDTGSWVDTQANPRSVASATVTFTSGSTLYPTDTAGQVDPNGSTHDSKEAWTSVGAGSTNAVTNTAAAPASPLLLTTSAGGNFIEWYTRKLQAFTLAGPVVVSVQAKESNAAANSSFPGLEIAVCAADGTSPVVWGYALPGSLEPPTTDGTFTTFFVAGDDVAVTSGQRLRLRYYIDDTNAAAMASGQTVTFVYADTPAPSTKLLLGQVLAEATASAPPGLTDFYRQNNLIRR